MRNTVSVFFQFLLLFSVTTSAWSEPQSCKRLNDAYDATRNSSRYQVKIYYIAPHETDMKFVLDQRWNGVDMYELDRGRLWKKTFRYQYNSTNSSGPVFSNCRRLPDQSIDGNNVEVFEADWHREPRRAKITAKVSIKTGLFAETMREMTAVGKNPYYDIGVGQKIIEKFTYDRNVPIPPPFE